MVCVRLRAAWAGAALALAWGACASADEFAERRATCEPVLTVVDDTCVVANLYACPDDGQLTEVWKNGSLEGWVTHGPDQALGLASYGVDDEEVRVVSHIEREFSLSELLEEGRIIGAHTVDLAIMSPAARPAWIGLDANSTEELERFGTVEFRTARMTRVIRFGAGGLNLVATGTLFIDEVRRVTLFDMDRVTVGETVRDHPGETVQAMLAGEPGFMATSASSCEGLLSLDTFHPEPPHG